MTQMFSLLSGTSYGLLLERSETFHSNSSNILEVRMYFEMRRKYEQNSNTRELCKEQPRGWLTNGLSGNKDVSFNQIIQLT